jgi:phenolic acid decarboxylase
MKKLFFMLLLPVLSFSQSYEEIMKINSEDIFVRYMVENGFESDFNKKNKKIINYRLNPIKVGGKARWDGAADYEKTSGIFRIGFNLASSESKRKYNKIYDLIKEKCVYGKSQNGLVFYSCIWKEEYQKIITVSNFNRIGMFSSSSDIYAPDYKYKF